MWKEIHIEEEKNLSFLEAIREIEKEAFGPKAWSSELLKSELEKDYSILLTGRVSEEVLGFLLGRIIPDEAEILRLAVRPSFWRRGLGSKLLENFLERMRKHRIKRVFLEVSTQNEGALKLYQKFGFKILAERKNYYEDSSALLMGYQF